MKLKLKVMAAYLQAEIPWNITYYCSKWQIIISPRQVATRNAVKNVWVTFIEDKIEKYISNHRAVRIGRPGNLEADNSNNSTSDDLAHADSCNMLVTCGQLTRLHRYIAPANCYFITTWHDSRTLNHYSFRSKTGTRGTFQQQSHRVVLNNGVESLYVCAVTWL